MANRANIQSSAESQICQDFASPLDMIQVNQALSNMR